MFAQLNVLATALTQYIENADYMQDEPTRDEAIAQVLLDQINAQIVALCSQNVN